MKLFFKRAPEMRGCSARRSPRGYRRQPDVHDRAAMYARCCNTTPKPRRAWWDARKRRCHTSRTAPTRRRNGSPNRSSTSSTPSPCSTANPRICSRTTRRRRCRGRPPRSTCALPRRTAAARRYRRIASSISATTRGRTPPAGASTSTIFSGRRRGGRAGNGAGNGAEQRERELELPGSVGRADGGDGTGTRAWADDDSAAVFAPFGRSTPRRTRRAGASSRRRPDAPRGPCASPWVSVRRRAHRAASAHDAPRRADSRRWRAGDHRMR